MINIINENIYTKISKQLFFGLEIETDNKYKSILSATDYNSKTLLILDYIYYNRILKGLTPFSLEDMIIKSGFIPKSGFDENKKPKITEQFKLILKTLQELKVIDFKTDDEDKLKAIDNIKPTKYYECELLLDMDKNYFMLAEEDKNKILHYENKKVDSSKLLLFYCYILSRMYHRPADCKDIQICHGKSETCYFTYKRACGELHLSETSLTTYINTLVDLDLIRYRNAGDWCFKDDVTKRTQTSCNTYVLYDTEGYWKNELKDAIKAFKAKHPERIFTDIDKEKEKLKSENGFIHKVSALEKKGKAKQKDINKKNRLIKEHEEKNQRKQEEYTTAERNCFELKSLWKNPEYEGMLVSEIYNDRGQCTLSDKYYEWEQLLDDIEWDDEGRPVDWTKYRQAILRMEMEQEESNLIPIEGHKKHSGLQKNGQEIEHINDNSSKAFTPNNLEQLEKIV